MSVSAKQSNSQIVSISPHIIAVNTGLDLNATGVTASTWVNGASLATHFPTMIIVELASGAIGGAVFKPRANATVLFTQSLAVLTTVNYRAGFNIANNFLLANTGNLDVNISTASSVACTANIYWVGISLV